MMTKIGVAGAVALVAFLAASSPSLAAHKKGAYDDPTKCTGGSCTAANPDRVVNRDEISFGFDQSQGICDRVGTFRAAVGYLDIHECQVRARAPFEQFLIFRGHDDNALNDIGAGDE